MGISSTNVAVNKLVILFGCVNYQSGEVLKKIGFIWGKIDENWMIFRKFSIFVVLTRNKFLAHFTG